MEVFLKTSNSSKVLYGLLIMLHMLLVLLHVGLVVTWACGAEHAVIIPVARAGAVSSRISAASQIFIVTYVACLLFITQYLSLNRMLLRPKNVTAVHDISTAWTGLGSAIFTLARQFSIPAAVSGTLSITIYLVTAGQFDGGHATNQRSHPGDNTVWAAAIQLLPYLSIVGNQSTLGLANPTLYDILDQNDGVGNTTVNATTAEVECFNVPNTTATFSNIGEEYLWTINAVYDKYDMNFYFLGILDSGVVQHLTWYDQETNTTLLLGRNIIFLTTFYVVDSQGNAGSYVSGYNYTNLQAIGCTLSWTPTKAVVDTGSRYVLAMEPGRAINRSSAWSEWKPGLQTSAEDGENLQDDVWAAMFECSLNSPLLYGASSLPNGDGELLPMSQIDEYIMTALGQPGGGNVTLTQLENTLSDLSSSIFWASVHLLPSSEQENDTSIVRGSTVVPQTVSRLNVNPIPLFFGLVASVLLLVLAVFLTYGVTKANYMLDGMGPLHVIWLTAEHADLRKRITSVGEPATSGLRRAGMLETISLDHSASHVTLVDMEYTRVDGKDNE